MRHASAVSAAGDWPLDRQVASITLTHQDRHRRRIRLEDDSGQPLMLDLPEARYLAHGDGLVVNDGYVRVIAADEEICDIITDTAAEAARIAWHVGNRHTPMQIVGDCHLRILYDHVLAQMIEGLGGQVQQGSAPFNPEQGAYAGGHHHG